MAKVLTVDKFKKAYDSLRANGRDIVYKRKSYTVSPSTPWDPTRNDEEVNLKGLFSGTHQSTSVEGNIKRASNIVSMVPTDLGFLPQIGDTISDIDFTYTVTDVIPTQPGSVAFLYKVEVKK